jgi:hypothetical protein
MKLSPFRFLFLVRLAGSLDALIGCLAVNHLDQRLYARPGSAATTFEWRTATPESQGMSKEKLDALKDVLAVLVFWSSSTRIRCCGGLWPLLRLLRVAQRRRGEREDQERNEETNVAGSFEIGGTHQGRNLVTVLSPKFAT